MGVFFDARKDITELIPRSDSKIEDRLIDNRLDYRLDYRKLRLETEPAKTFKPWRFVGALLFLAGMFVAGIYCAHDDKLQEWSKVLLHGFEILLGAVIGIVIGEGQS